MGAVCRNGRTILTWLRGVNIPGMGGQLRRNRQPELPLNEEFKTDCLVYMLFSGSNLAASADDIEWNGRTWSIVNHFIPFTEQEVGSNGRFESDFMVRYLRDKELSSEAGNVMSCGKEIWQSFFMHTDVRKVREELRLNRPDVGWYQIRRAIMARNSSGDFPPISFSDFEIAYKHLAEKLLPDVYRLGFLKP